MRPSATFILRFAINRSMTGRVPLRVFPPSMSALGTLAVSGRGMLPQAWYPFQYRLFSFDFVGAELCSRLYKGKNRVLNEKFFVL